MRGILPPGKLCKDILQYSSGLLQHLIVPVARYGKTFGEESRVTSYVALRFRTLASVNFDHQTLVEAGEVENVIFDRNLSAKLVGR